MQVQDLTRELQDLGYQVRDLGYQVRQLQSKLEDVERRLDREITNRREITDGLQEDIGNLREQAYLKPDR
jgi:predicted RNase H-like nuclease (RuvC/YqgF family)